MLLLNIVYKAKYMRLEYLEQRVWENGNKKKRPLFSISILI